MVLVDTSVWIEVFKKKTPLNIDLIVDFDEIAVCLPVVQEVLQGFRDETAYRTARDAMLALPIVESPIGASVIMDAVSLYRSARLRGLTVRSSVDCLIAACAIRHDLTIVHNDRDFAQIAKISGLKTRTIHGSNK